MWLDLRASIVHRTAMWMFVDRTWRATCTGQWLASLSGSSTRGATGGATIIETQFSSTACELCAYRNGKLRHYIFVRPTILSSPQFDT